MTIDMAPVRWVTLGVALTWHCGNLLVLPASALPTNFVLLMADDMGWGDVSYNNVSSRIFNPGAGGEKFVVNPPRTPELDKMARSENSIVFHRFYASSAVCSPTRSSCLTGRTSDRECIDGAEGCGQMPAWGCSDGKPLSPRTFTIAEAAKKAGYATFHAGKWHLGNFFPKNISSGAGAYGRVSTNQDSKPSSANKKWPVSSPRTHGFDEWHSTEASASSSLCNCGCNASWSAQLGGDPLVLPPGSPPAPPAVGGVGCITGGGNFSRKSYDCTNYWGPTDLSTVGHKPTNPTCSSASASTLTGCVGNRTTKILGDDTLEIMNYFEEFLSRKAPGKSEAAPFLAVLWLHTNHVPHPAMPEWFNAYVDANGQPAGDYLGTISQMDNQIGRLRAMLKIYGVAENTAVWFTADNGPHTNGGEGGKGPYARTSNQATNGLRQCKASLFEGGIREPGILEWPAMIKANRETEFPAYTSDYLPTFLDVIGMSHPQPSWAIDGISLLPLIRQAARELASEVRQPLQRITSDRKLLVATRSKPLGFKVGTQEAWIDNDWKILAYPHKGQCKTLLPPYDTPGATERTFLFNLREDPTETHDLSAAEPARFKAMSAAMASWTASILVSQMNESECAAGGGETPTPSPSPLPPSPVPNTGFSLKHGQNCLTLDSIGVHKGKYKVMLGACDQGSKWDTGAPDLRKSGNITAAPYVINVFLPSGNNLLKLDKRGGEKMCSLGNDILTGAAKGDNAFTISTVGSAKLLAAAGCPAMYVGACTSGSDVCLVARSQAMEFTLEKSASILFRGVKNDDDDHSHVTVTEAGSHSTVQWDIVSAAALNGDDFKNASISFLAEEGPIVWQVCRDLCAKNTSCSAFDHVGADLEQGATDVSKSRSGGLKEGQCWFRIDGIWDPHSNHKRNHTSGHLIAPPPPVPRPPAGAKNVLFIIFDDYRAMHKVYGWAQPHLPNADGLARESLVFDRAYVQQAVCGPSRASLMRVKPLSTNPSPSGRRPDRTQMWNFEGGFRQTPGADQWNTFPEWFWKHGFYSAGCGKLYHPGDPASFDPQSWSEPMCKTNFPYFGQGKCPIPKEKLTQAEVEENGGCSVDLALYPNATFPDAETLKVGLQFLRKASLQRNTSGTPFWLGVGFVKPHLPHVYPSEFGLMVPKASSIDLPLHPNITANCAAIEYMSEGPTHGINSPATAEQTQNLRHAYYAAAAFSDSLLGTLLKEVDTLNLRQDTAVVLTADHGWGLGEHNHFIKYTNWETDVRVPLMIRAPWKPAAAGRRTAALVEHVDLYPSLAEIAGIPVDKGLESIDGTSWARLLDDPKAAHKSAVFAQYPRCWPENTTHDSNAFSHMARCAGVAKDSFAYMGYTIRTQSYRYTEWAAWDGHNLKPLWDVSGGVELYDHTADPPASSLTSFDHFENTNEAEEVRRAALVADLSTKLRAFFDGH